MKLLPPLGVSHEVDSKLFCISMKAFGLLLDESNDLSCVMRKPTFCINYAKTKMQISFAVTAKLISAFFFLLHR